jgi:hypothetical protein
MSIIVRYLSVVRLAGYRQSAIEIEKLQPIAGRREVGHRKSTVVARRLSDYIEMSVVSKDHRIQYLQPLPQWVKNDENATVPVRPELGDKRK